MDKIITFVLCRLIKFLVGATPRYFGDSLPSGQTIYFANHTSHMDALALWSALPKNERKKTHPVAAKDYWGKTKFKQYIATKCLNAILLDREVRHGTNPLMDLYEALDRGESLIIFPEGTRSSDGIIKDFKSGIYNLAKTHPTIQLTPVYLDNFHRCLPKGSLIVIPLACSVRFGNPIYYTEQENKKEFLARAKQSIMELS